VQYSAASILTPATERELYQMLMNSTGPIKALGSRHSFSSIADSRHNGTLFRMTEMNKVQDCCYENTVTVQPGMTYAALGKFLDKKGFALSNYASLPHISIGGALMTSTHGSGFQNSILADSVLSYEMMLMDGASWIVTTEDTEFYTGLVSVGSVGFLVSVTLRIEPQFQVQQCIYPNINWDILLDNGSGDSSAEQFFQRAYSVSAFTNWQPDKDGTYDMLSSVWLKHKLTDTDSNNPSDDATLQCPKLYGVEARSFHPLPSRDPFDCSPNGVGPSHVMLPHFLPDNEPSGGGNELQSEYFIALSDAIGALHALRGIAHKLAPYTQVSEFRVVASDLFPLSVCFAKTSHGKPCFGIHFTWINDVDGVTTKMLPLVEKTLEIWEPRPHHSKLHSLSSRIWKQRYSGADAVQKTALKYDPEHRLSNDWLKKYMYPQKTEVHVVEALHVKDKNYNLMLEELHALVDVFESEDAMDQILIDQVDDILAEDEEDADILLSLESSLNDMQNSELFELSDGSEGAGRFEL